MQDKRGNARINQPVQFYDWQARSVERQKSKLRKLWDKVTEIVDLIPDGFYIVIGAIVVIVLALIGVAMKLTHSGLFQ